MFSFRLETSISFVFCGSISVFGHVCVKLQSLKSGAIDTSRSVFLKYHNFISKLEHLSIFPGRLMSYQIF